MLTFTAAPAADHARALPVGPRARLLVIDEETGGQAYYERTEMHPTWPGGFSGVTVGCGYDCGYADGADGIRRDWASLLPAAAVEALAHTAGIHGSPAAALAHELAWVSVPWAAALAVFDKVDLPAWASHVAQDLAHCERLHPDAYGALVSVAFNRGRSWNIAVKDDPAGRYAEMRAIRALMASEGFDRIPGEILAMRRLWAPGSDLWRRRGHEAALFADAMGVAVPAGAGLATPLTPTLSPLEKRGEGEQAPRQAAFVPADRQGSGG